MREEEHKILALRVVPGPIVGIDYPIGRANSLAVVEVAAAVVVHPTTRIVGEIVEIPMDCLLVGEGLEREFPMVSLVVDTLPIVEEGMSLPLIRREHIRGLREGDFVLLQGD